jgi:hypothetical protein
MPTSSASGSVTPNLTLGSYGDIYSKLNALQQTANLGRIPGAADLESESSKRIAELLNPPALFTDTSRQAAELGAGRGISSSAAAYSGGLRMTDEERLKRIALGESLLTGAYGRNPTAVLPNVADFGISESQAAELNARKQALSDQIKSQEYIANQRYNTPGYGNTPGTSMSGMVGDATRARAKNPSWLEPDYGWFDRQYGDNSLKANTGSMPWMPGGMPGGYDPGLQSWLGGYGQRTDPYRTGGNTNWNEDQFGDLGWDYSTPGNGSGGQSTSYDDFEAELFGLGWD